MRGGGAPRAMPRRWRAGRRTAIGTGRPRRRPKAIKYAASALPPVFIINCKNYDEAMTARDVRSLVGQARRSSARHGVAIAVAPPATLLAVAAAEAGAAPSSAAPSWTRPPPARPGGRRRRRAPLPLPRRPLVLAQHADDAGPGSTTGRIVAEAVRAAGADGSLVNHSEYRMPAARRGAAAGRLRRAGLLSVVCAATPGEVRSAAGLGPDYVAIEPPELIGTGRAVSRERPGLISMAALAVERAAPPSPPAPFPTRLLCGAGIAAAEDVRRAVELGSAGVLVASGIVKAQNRAAAIDSFAKALAEATLHRADRASRAPPRTRASP